jgi:hypothetical protein
MCIVPLHFQAVGKNSKSKIVVGKNIKVVDGSGEKTDGELV